jgi:hypothetical protein
VITELLDGYAEGIYLLPEEMTTVTKVYSSKLAATGDK